MYVAMKHIEKHYGTFKASDDVSFGIEKGKLVALLGPSGSGKTTILRMLAGLEYPDSGDIFINNRRINNIPAAKRGIGFVFQNYALFRYMTVFDNVAFGLTIQKRPKKEIEERVQYLIQLVGLSGMDTRYPNQLSGGQRQRVAFARALAPNPQVLLLDEPFAAIDAKVRQGLRNWLKETIHRVGITSIFVTHDQEEAVEVADEIIVTNHGRIEQVGTPQEIYKTPQTPFVAQFIGNSTIVDNYSKLKGFAFIQGADQAVIRPEFVKIYKKEPCSNMAVPLKKEPSKPSCSAAIIWMFPFASKDCWSMAVGETVQVLIYRLYIFDKERTYLTENSAMKADNVFYI